MHNSWNTVNANRIPKFVGPGFKHVAKHVTVQIDKYFHNQGKTWVKHYIFQPDYILSTACFVGHSINRFKVLLRGREAPAWFIEFFLQLIDPL